MKILAIIPARGGSKSIPRKNIKIFNGHPLIAYSIAAAGKSKKVNRIIVSTEDKESAKIARNYGAEVPFLRPKNLAGDDVSDLPVFKHALSWLDKEEKYRPDIIVQLRPTSPLRPKGCVDEGVYLLLNTPMADSVRAVTPAPHNPYKMWHIKDSFLIPIIQCDLHEPYNANRQNLPQAFWQTGHLDITRYETIMQKNSMTGKYIMPLMIEPKYAIDLDTLDDWEFAEWKSVKKELDIVRPDYNRSFFSGIRMVVLDFDGVFTDNRVYITDDANESVVCNRSDGMGLALLKAQGIEVAVISSEINPVVSARCNKLNLICYQGIKDKKSLFKDFVSKRGLSNQEVLYVGNDVNDLECMRLAKIGVAVADAHPQVLKAADLVLSKRGGQGAIRELCDLIISSINKKEGEQDV